MWAQDHADLPADTVEDRPASDPPGIQLLETIVVTAEKRETSLKRVPISVQAFSPEALEARGIDSQLGLTRAVPSLDVGSQAGYATIFLRGVGTEAFLTADPSIASYVDGVYFPFSPTFVQEFAGLERVEVLKGPQGTLFGRNAVGGAILVTSKAPDFEAAVTNLDVSFGSFNRIKPRLYTNIPVSEHFAVNLSAYYESLDPHLRGTSAGKPLRDHIGQGVRLRAAWAPVENLELALAWTRARSLSNGAIGQNLRPSPFAQNQGISPPEDPRRVAVDVRLYGVANTQVLGAEVKYSLPWLDIKLLGSDQLNSLLYNYDFDGSENPYVAFDVPGHPADIQQGELQLISAAGMPGSDWLELTGGAFWFRNLQGFKPVEITVGDTDPTAALGSPILNGGNAYRVRCVAQVATQSIGYYLQGKARLTDWLSLTLGGRYQDEDRGVAESTVSVLAGSLDVLGGPAVTWMEARDEQGNTVPLSDNTSGFFPKVALGWNPFEHDSYGLSADTLVFASWQRAEKAHAYNAFAVYLSPQYIRPEETTAWEVGLRTRTLGGLFRFNLAAFQSDIVDQQVQYVSLFTGGALAFENAQRSRSRGIDFDLVAQVLPSLFDGLAISLNGAFLDAKFLQYTEASGYDPATGMFQTDTLDFSGNRQTRSPKRSGSIALTKIWYLGDNLLEVGTDYYYNSGVFYAASEDPAYEQAAYRLLGGFVRLKNLPMKLELKLFGSNLTNEFYTQGVISTDYGGIFTIAPPVEYGVRVAWEFGY